mmetsp:Transcript_112719/g.318888  ORF Transcript_112719/g.318888 Transcript_112719/m.318888 type:complete len:310 (-) Transcript_112719:186-1115(-)
MRRVCGRKHDHLPEAHLRLEHEAGSLDRLRPKECHGVLQAREDNRMRGDIVKVSVVEQDVAHVRNRERVLDDVPWRQGNPEVQHARCRTNCGVDGLLHVNVEAFEVVLPVLPISVDKCLGAVPRAAPAVELGDAREELVHVEHVLGRPEPAAARAADGGLAVDSRAGDAGGVGQVDRAAPGEAGLGCLDQRFANKLAVVDPLRIKSCLSDAQLAQLGPDVQQLAAVLDKRGVLGDRLEADGLSLEHVVGRVIALAVVARLGTEAGLPEGDIVADKPAARQNARAIITACVCAAAGAGGAVLRVSGQRLQ